ncbi:MAG: allantoinase AllB [Opitutales bacterium]
MLIKNGKFVSSTEIIEGDMLIQDGIISEIGSELSAAGDHPTVELAGNIVLPAAIDAHVHFNEPGRADWEGWETGSRAALAGGITSVFEMPLNANPPTLTAELFFEKRKVAEQKSRVDFGLWGGLTPINLEHIESLADAGVIGFKAFMSSSGLDDFPRVDRASLKAGMEIIAGTGKILALHAEDEALTQRLAREAREQGIEDIQAWLTSRPIDAELLAIREALDLANETGCKIHIVHISNAPGFDMVEEAQAAGVDVSAETCPHYLDLIDEDIYEHGALAKCAPPLRDANTRDGLWSKLMDGSVNTVGSDHSPCLTSMKLGIPFSQAWGGISGIQHFLNPFINRVIETGDLSWQRLVDLSSTYVANRFGIPDRGNLNAGSLADLVIIDPNKETQVKADEILYQNPHSPYIGKTWKGRIEGTIIRGQLIQPGHDTARRGHVIQI